MSWQAPPLPASVPVCGVEQRASLHHRRVHLSDVIKHSALIGHGDAVLLLRVQYFEFSLTDPKLASLAPQYALIPPQLASRLWFVMSCRRREVKFNHTTKFPSGVNAA